MIFAVAYAGFMLATLFFAPMAEVAVWLRERRESKTAPDDSLPLPWPPEDGFVPVRSLLNPITGESVPMATEMHSEDLDWLTRSWQDVFAMEWKVRAAAREGKDIE